MENLTNWVDDLEFCKRIAGNINKDYKGVAAVISDENLGHAVALEDAYLEYCEDYVRRRFRETGISTNNEIVGKLTRKAERNINK